MLYRIARHLPPAPGRPDPPSEQKREDYSGEIRINGDLILFETKYTAFGNQAIDACKFKIMPPEKRLLLAEMKCGPLAYPISSEVR